MKYPYAFILCLLGWLFTSCQSIEPLSIDYLVPAEVSYPKELKRVAVVNNMPTPKAANVKEEVAKENEYGVTFKTQRFAGQPDVTVEVLAEELANGNYFEQVIICDSALRAQDQTPRKEALTREEIQQLTESLGVDFLIALEDVHFLATRKVEFTPYYQAFLGVTDLKAYPTVSIYLPQRNGPTTSLQTNDSIFWESFGSDISQAATRLIPQKKMLKEASEFAGSIPAKTLLPHWKTAQRYIFAGGSAPMRDALIYIRENNWPEAINQWQKCYEQKKGKKKMQAAHNLAIGYEMQDSIPEALEWARKAQKLAYECDKVEEKKNRQGINATDAPHYALTSFYVSELEKRNSDLLLLNIQMERFKE